MRPLHLKSARRRITATRDDNGVPHVVADSWRSALYALGYLHALDRATQLLFARAVASGRSAEFIADKPQLVETDRFFRRVGLDQHLDREVSALDDKTFGDLTAYCEGVNDGMKETGRSLPMWAVGFHPTPWNQKSVLLIGNLLSYGGLAVGQQQNERILVDLVQAGVDESKLKELFSPLLDNADFDLLRKVKMANQLSDEALELITDLPRLAGSNAWAIAPRRSASGTALLAADPHLEINRLPPIWYEAVLQWGDHYVMGATLPGCPLFAVARTERLSWGVTYLKADTSDYFVEDCRPGGATGWQYRRGDQWQDFAVREEVITHKGGESEALRVYHNEQGTLDCDPEASGPGYLLSLAWVGSNEGAGRSIGTWLDVVQSESTLQGMHVARSCPQPTLCWLFADREGHIGLQAAGWVPKRPPENSGLLPVPAWDVRNHWRGRIDENSLPSIFDPPEGFVANANENINPPGGPAIITLPLPNYRIRRIREVLSGLPKVTLDEMKALQYDVVSLQARDLLAIFLPHMPAGELKDRLATWDFNYSADSREATLFLGLYRNVLLEIFGDVGEGQPRNIGWRRMLYLCSRIGYSTMVLTSIDRLLHRDESLWWEGRNKGELIRRAAERLAQSIAKEREKPWGQTNALQFTNRFFENPRMGRALGFHTGELPLAGCHATPFQGHLLTTAKRETSFAPSYHFVTDIGTNEAWTNLPGGPSESRFSPYYKSDLQRWLAGEYKRLAPDI